MALNPTVLLVPELPLFLWQVLLVNLALGLKGLTETDSLAAWSVCTLPEVREASAGQPSKVTSAERLWKLGAQHPGARAGHSSVA